MDEIARLSSPRQVFAWCGTPFDDTGIAALFALDRQFGDILRTTVQPIVGQMRFTWWYEALRALDGAPPPAQPLLAEIAACVLGQGVTGHALAEMSSGWEILLDEERSDAGSLLDFARLRGGQLFVAAGRLLGSEAQELEAAGMAWALADLAANVSQSAISERAQEASLALGEQVFAGRWRDARVLGALALDARAAMLGRGQGEADGPRRAIKVARFRLLGR